MAMKSIRGGGDSLPPTPTTSAEARTTARTRMILFLNTATSHFEIFRPRGLFRITRHDCSRRKDLSPLTPLTESGQRFPE